MTTLFKPGLVHTPVTPFTRDNAVDFPAYAKLLEFHVRNGAQSLALPMHVGESVSLGDAERRSLLEFALKHVAKRIPVIAHVSQSGTAMAVALAKHAEAAGAAAIVATSPYYWTPPPAMLLEHLAQIGAAVRIPYFVYNAPDDMGGTKIGTETALKLIEKLENFSGLVDTSLDWQFMIELIAAAERTRPGFQLLSGNEYMIPAAAIGASGAFSPLSGMAPRLLRRLHDLCVKEQYRDALPLQEEFAALRQLVKKSGVPGIKAGMRAMGRDCGIPRPPLEAPGEVEYAKLAEQLGAMAALRDEPRGW
jgi:4-hydroxy-tetrahydrodipicolinate synthase